MQTLSLKHGHIQDMGQISCLTETSISLKVCFDACLLMSTRPLAALTQLPLSIDCASHSHDSSPNWLSSPAKKKRKKEMMHMTNH